MPVMFGQLLAESVGRSENNEYQKYGRELQGVVKRGQNVCRDKRYICMFKAVEVGTFTYLGMLSLF